MSEFQRVLAPAKLTWSLHVGSRRENGLHEIDAEMLTLDLADELVIVDGGEGIVLESESGARANDLTLGSENLIMRALDLAGRRAAVRLKKVIPYTWLVDPAPLPPHAAIPELNLTDWSQLKVLSQKERDLILKVSGFSELAWGARGVYLGSDLSQADWSAAVDAALKNFERSPSVLQRYEKPKTIEASWFDFSKNEGVPMKSRTRLCPYYFVAGEGDSARAQLGGVLATIVPADKKIVHGMSDAILAPCAA